MTNFITTITQKRQITLRKELMETLNLKIGEKIVLSLIDKNKKRLQIESVPDFMEIAGKIKVKNPIDPVEARARMEREYERV